MTHDELLMRLWEKRNALCDNLDVHFALSAVVELHKPRITLVNRTTGATRQKCRCEADYPCPTIQAIEEQLR